MVRCSVLGCKSDGEIKIPKLSFHSFPEEENIKTKWIDATGRKNWIPKKFSKICSVHFIESDFINKKKLRFLQPNATPIMKSHINRIDSPNMGSEVDETPNMTVQVKHIAHSTFGSSGGPEVSLVTSQARTEYQQRSGIKTITNVNETNSPKCHDRPMATDNHHMPDSRAQVKHIANSVPDPSWRSEVILVAGGDHQSKTEHQKISGVEMVKSSEHTPRTMKTKWKRTRQQSAQRLKKLKSLREKCRRLTKKVADFRNIIAELKAKFMINEEDGDLLQSIDPVNKD